MTMEERVTAAAQQLPDATGDLLVTLTDKIEAAGLAQREALDATGRYDKLRREVEALMTKLNLPDVGSGRFQASLKTKRLRYIDPVLFLRAVKKQSVLRDCLTVNLMEAKAQLATSVYGKLEQQRDGKPSLTIRERKA